MFQKLRRNTRAAVNIGTVVLIVIGFVIMAIATPVALNYLYSINATFNASGTTATYSAVFTIFNVLLPVLYLIGVALYFVPRGGGK